jgi:hypothetical protein
MPPSFKAFDTGNVRRFSGMKVRNLLLVLAVISITWDVRLSGQLPEQPYGKSSVNRMFVDAHSPDEPINYSRSEIKKMIQDAKTPEEFGRLADYFDYRSMEFEQKSEDQLRELQRLLALPYHSRTYPSQVDYTRELIKRYKAQAQECSDRADAFREDATPGSGGK